MDNLKQALDAVAEHGSITKAARVLGIPRTTLQSRLARAEQESTIVLDEEIPSLREIQEAVFDLKNHEPEPPKWLLNPAKGSSFPGTPVIHLSDLHWGEVIDSDRVQGFNTYNMAIANKRLRTVIEHAVDVCLNHTVNSAKFPGIVLCLGGDMLSGDIHEELMVTNEASSLRTVLDLYDKLVWVINTLQEHFGNVVVFTAYGNHSRLTTKPVHKIAAETNFDWFLYNMLARHYSDNDRITINVAVSFDTIFRVYNHTFLLTHGDRIGSGGGDGVIGALGPILRGARRIISTYASQGEKIDTILMGHWHQWIPLPWVRVNGSLKGFDEYAMFRRFPPERPTQDLFLVHPKYGITFNMPIFCGGEEMGGNSEWVSIRGGRE